MNNRFDLGHDIDLGFSRSNMEFAISYDNMIRLAPTRPRRINDASGQNVYEM